MALKKTRLHSIISITGAGSGVGIITGNVSSTPLGGLKLVM